MDLISSLQSREVSSRELLQLCLTRIAKRDAQFAAWERVYPLSARQHALSADDRLSARSVARKGAAHPLCGVPFGIKDVLGLRGQPLTFGSRAFHDNTSSKDAEVIRRLRDAQAVLLGHTKSQEFADGRSPQVVANPWNLLASPGGSSNGSAAAVGGRTVPVALGTDTAGSLRRPASACGLSTMMGTYGSVSNDGTFTTSSDYTQIGPVTVTARDAALVFASLAGPSCFDPYTPDAGTQLAAGLRLLTPTLGRRPLKGTRIGILVDFAESTAPEVGDLFDDLVLNLVQLGAECRSVTAPSPCPSALDPSPGVVDFHDSNFPTRGYLYSIPQRRLVADALSKAPSVTSLDHFNAMKDRTLYSRAWSSRYQELGIDAVLSPSQTAETPKSCVDPSYNDLEAFGSTEIRRMWNVAGFPVVGIPMGLTATEGMPVGVQIAGLPWSEHIMAQLAVDYQAHSSHHQLIPRSPEL